MNAASHRFTVKLVDEHQNEVLATPYVLLPDDLVLSAQHAIHIGRRLYRHAKHHAGVSDVIRGEETPT